MYIAVTSGKGGTGKTLVSTSLALAVGKCTYMDLDVEEPNGFIFLKPEVHQESRYSLPIPEINKEKCTFCEACAKACAYHALAIIPSLKKTMFFDELCHSCGVCAYVCPVEEALKEIPREIGTIRTGKTGEINCIEGRLDVGRPSGVPLISGMIDRFIHSDGLIFADSPPGTSCPVVESIKKSDFVILVTEPTPFGLNDLKLTVEIVKTMGKDAGIIINKDNSDHKGKNEGKRNLIDEYSQQEGIPILLRIPYSLQIQEAYSRGIPLVKSMPEIKNEMMELVDTLLSDKRGNPKGGTWEK